MSEIMANMTRRVWNYIVILILIVAILLAANWFRNEWKEISIQLKLASLLDDQIEDRQDEIKELRNQSEKLGAEARKQMEELNSSQKITSKLWSEARQAESKHNDAINELNDWVPNFLQGEKVARRDLAWAEYEGKKKAAEASQFTTDAIKRTTENSPWSSYQKKIEEEQAEVNRLESQRKEFYSDKGKTPQERLVMDIRNVLPTALWTLVGIILAPILIKAFLYYCLAPLISRTKPVVVVPTAKGEIQTSPSEVSIPVTLEPGDELIVHSDFLQASGVGPGKRTRWLFSWRMPFTSVAAGLYGMVDVRNRQDDNSKVTVSPKKDLFVKICDVRIEAGSAMVIYPRSLVGIVMKKGVAPRITRHWYLRSLHSWVTFQFRYLVIHGESRILMKGCRGVRAERVEITKPAMQDKLATLGFSANLAYSGTRCETFVDYLLGRDELFNDRFSDSNGFYFTEEIPSPNRKSGFFGRGLEGLIDGFLKAFGI
jgi:hypothetical protein